MKELAGRLTALDPEASETLKVVTYFDALIAGGVGLPALVRGAALLSGTAAGVAVEAGHDIRFAPVGDGDGDGGSGAADWPTRQAGPDAAVWIERRDAPHMNDAMVLERFAFAVAITRSRRAADDGAHHAVETLIDETAGPTDRVAAAARLHLDGSRPVRAVAVPLSEERPPGGPAAVVAAPFGLVRAIVLPEAATPTASRAGVGTAGSPHDLHSSWSSALVALRLTDAIRPVVHADDLGAMLLLVQASDERPAPPDVAALAAVAEHASSLATLDALAAASTVRSAARALGIHHSTMQARLTALTAALGYDPRTPTGRTRFVLARAVLTARTARFD